MSEIALPLIFLNCFVSNNIFFLLSLCNQPVRGSPKLLKGSGFSRISIKRVSGVISSSLRLPSVTNDQPNSVFYTGKSGRPRHKKPDFFWGGGFLDDLEQKLFYSLPFYLKFL